MIIKHKKSRHAKKSKRIHKKHSSEVMVNKTPISRHQIVPSKYITKIEFGFDANYAAGLATTTHFEISGSSPYLPLTAVNFSGLPLSTVFAGNLVNQGGGAVAIAALNSSGLKQLFGNVNQLYGAVRVLGAKLTITYTPSVGADTSQLSIRPYAQDDSGNAQTYSDLTLPFTKSIMCTGNNNIKQNTLTVFMPTRDILGYKQRQVIDDETMLARYNGLTSTYTPSGNGWAFDVRLNTLSGNVTTAISFITCKVQYFCMFEQPQTTLANVV